MGLLGLDPINDDSQGAIDVATSIAQIEEAAEIRLNSMKMQALLARQAAQQKIDADRYAAEKAAIAALAKQQQIITAKDLEARKAKYAADEEQRIAALECDEQEREAKIKAIKEETAARIAADNKIYKNQEKTIANLTKKELEKQEKIKKAQAKAAGQESVKDVSEALFSGGKSLKERKDLLKDAFTGEDGGLDLKKGLASTLNALSDLAVQMQSQINGIASSKSAIDTRLQGSKNKTNYAGSYWEKMSTDIVGVAGVSPFVTQSSIVENIKSMVGSGISYNVEQRAFLQTIKDKIATTFDANNSTLLRLVRIQQQDSTAARLGMESAMTSFLNNMYETTEYLTQVSSSVKTSLENAMSLMSAVDAVGFEYQVQKWMGSMYSVGMEQSSVTSIASALGKLAAGDISSITGGGVGNLLIMAANKAGMSISDILNNGLTDNGANKLLSAMASYLIELNGQAGSSNVIKQQLASVYGLSAADLKAATNLSSSLGNISSNGLSYSGAMKQLTNMMNTMALRTSQGEMMSNIWDNFKYTMSAGIANSPVLYALYNVASLLDATTNGIAIPSLSVVGNSVDLETTVSDLMRVGALSGSLLSGIGAMITSGSGGGFSGSGMLQALGIGSGISTVSRGTGEGLLSTGGGTTSSSGYVGNSDSSAVYTKTVTDATDEANNDLVTAQEESTEVTNKQIDEDIVSIYTLLTQVIDGTARLKVTTESDELVSGTSWN